MAIDRFDVNMRERRKKGVSAPDARGDSLAHGRHVLRACAQVSFER